MEDRIGGRQLFKSSSLNGRRNQDDSYCLELNLAIKKDSICAALEAYDSGYLKSDLLGVHIEDANIVTSTGESRRICKSEVVTPRFINIKTDSKVCFDFHFDKSSEVGIVPGCFLYVRIRPTPLVFAPYFVYAKLNQDFTWSLQSRQEFESATQREAPERVRRVEN